MPADLLPRQPELEEVIITGALEQRQPRPRDFEAEIQALHSLAALLHAGQAATLEALMEAAVRLCGAGTAGVSLLQRGEDGAEVFRWVAVAGRLKDSVGGCTPRRFSPCGTCLDRGQAQLYSRPGRYFTYLEPAGIVEGLVVPFRGGDEVVGTIWVVSHDGAACFDREDLRMMTSLASFTATALRLKRASTEAERKLLEERETRRRAEEFVGLLGHELRVPLQLIAGGLERLRASAPEADGQLAGVERQVRNLSALVDGLVDLARVVRGTIPIRRQKLFLDTAVARAVEALRPRLEARRHLLTLRLERGIIVNADPLRLEQLVGNLLDNAIRYTPPGGALAVEVEAQGAEARVVVSDNGAGIPPEALQRVFEPFERLPVPPDCDAGGLGLGLTLVRRLAQLHGGFAVATSEGPGCGATFTVELPCTRLSLVAAST